MRECGIVMQGESGLRRAMLGLRNGLRRLGAGTSLIRARSGVRVRTRLQRGVSEGHCADTAEEGEVRMSVR